MIQKLQNCLWLLEVGQFHNLVSLTPESFQVPKVLIILWLFGKSFLNTWQSDFSALLTLHSGSSLLQNYVDLFVHSFSLFSWFNEFH